MKRIVEFIQENQTGLFRITVLLIMFYWTYLFHNIAKSIPDLYWVEKGIGSISKSLDDINSTLARR